MKKHSFIREIVTFSFIFIFLILVPVVLQIFQNNSYSFSFDKFPLIQFGYCIFSLLLLFLYNEKQEEILKNFGIFYKVIFPATFTFCVLFGVSLFFTFLTKIIPQNLTFLSNSSNVGIVKPNTFCAYFFCVLNFLFAACFEEIIYRFYLPEILTFFLTLKKDKKSLIIFGEILAALLFGIGHAYLGLIAVLNALLAHFILRRTFKKCGNLYSTIISHFLYNLLVFILL